MNSNIENYEKGICSEYKKHINLSIDQLKNKVIEVLEKEDKESKAIQKRKIWIKGFPWNSPNDAKKILLKILNQKQDDYVKNLKEIYFEQKKKE